LVPQLDNASTMLSQSPPSVQKTIQANIGDARVTDMTKGEENGVPDFVVSFTKDGQTRELKVAEDGRLLSIQVALAETPPVVQQAIQAQLGGDKLDSIEKTFDGEDVSYEVNITIIKDGRESKFTVGDDGAIQDVQIALSEAPAPVQKTVADQMAGGTLTTLTKIIDDRVTYDAEFTKDDGKGGEVTIAEDGALLSVEIPLAETGAAQATILEKVGNGKILSVKKSFEKRETFLPFKIESVKDGKSFNFSVSPEGRFLGMDD